MAIRYAPFFVPVLLHALLVAVAPSVRDSGDDGLSVVQRGALPQLGTGPVGEDGGAGPGGEPRTGATGPSRLGSSTREPGGGATSATAAGPGVPVTGIDPAQAGPWPWARGWELEGDRSRCAPDGQRQQDVTLFSPPCVPRYTDDNLGSTWRGVGPDTVRIVFYRTRFNPAVDSLAHAVGLGSTPEEDRADLETWGRFFNKRYEFYGRTVDWIFFQGACETAPADIACFRDEARQIVSQHDPFVVFDALGVPGEFYDELSRNQVMNVGGWHFTSGFNEAHRPYHWDYWMDGTLTVRNLADYWCKKLEGEPAARAGDPLMRAQTRKLGILAREGRDYAGDAQELARLVTGGMCGAGSSAPILTFQNDTARMQQQMTAVVAALKDEDVTTVVCLCDLIAPAFLTQAADQQQWFPEHLISGAGGVDYDFAGRLYSQAQWRNAFGPSHLAAWASVEEQDHFKAWYDVRDDGAPCEACLLVFWYQHLTALMVQNAGPNLNPLTVERGMFESAQLGGWENPEPWPGWSCCDPLLQQWSFGPGDYTAVQDSKEVTWSSTAVSTLDGQTGAYVCANDCARFPIGGWPAGDPPT